MKSNQYYVYIMTNFNNTVLYTGVTNDLQRRVSQHKSGEGGEFSRKFKATKLVYFESGSDIKEAILREKQIKGGSRQNKVDLVKSMNPGFKDLFDEL
jgi:putative endonuclease